MAPCCKDEDMAAQRLSCLACLGLCGELGGKQELEQGLSHSIVRVSVLEGQGIALTMWMVCGHYFLVGDWADHPSCWLNAGPALTPFLCSSDPEGCPAWSVLGHQGQ